MSCFSRCFYMESPKNNFNILTTEDILKGQRFAILAMFFFLLWFQTCSKPQWNICAYQQVLSIFWSRWLVRAIEGRVLRDIEKRMTQVVTQHPHLLGGPGGGEKKGWRKGSWEPDLEAGRLVSPGNWMLMSLRAEPGLAKIGEMT